jgi:hypothetical protein
MVDGFPRARLRNVAGAIGTLLFRREVRLTLIPAWALSLSLSLSLSVSV